MKRVVLAYSGGLDTTCCIPWLKEQGFEVICFSANLGGEFSTLKLKKRALRSGACKVIIKDLREEFAHQYVLPALKASAIYERKYVLSTALGRPLIAKYLAEVAKKERAAFVAHGCTAKGNDQLRFEVSIGILAPKLKIIAPLRQWHLLSREEEIGYAKKYKLPIDITKKKIYSIDKNLWGVSIEGGSLEDLSQPAPRNSYNFVKPLKDVAEREIYLEIVFKEGIPVKLNGKRFNLVNLIERLNKIGAEFGVGRTDLVEDRVVGIKSREVYEAPAAWILHTAHNELESLVLNREIIFFKQALSLRYTRLIYEGLWFTDLREGFDAFLEKVQKRVTGVVGLKLYKGNIIVVKRISPYSLYKKQFATYGKEDKFNRELAEGFIKLWGMPYVSEKLSSRA
jgi:argininosuccinate synthase